MPGDLGDNHKRKTGMEGRECKEKQQRSQRSKAEDEDLRAHSTKNHKKESLKEFAQASAKSRPIQARPVQAREENDRQTTSGKKDGSFRRHAVSELKQKSPANREPSTNKKACQNIKAGHSANKIKPKQGSKTKAPVYGALDLGTNNCRLLLARPNRQGFQIVDAFSRIIRLGEGVSETNYLSHDAMARTIDALQVCSAKLAFHKVNRARLVATQACRAAGNSAHFLESVASKTGLNLEIICQETEAKLAVSGCVPLIDSNCDYALIFDIGGGSSELIWIDIQKIRSDPSMNCINAEEAIVSWISLPVGVVTLAEKFGGKHVDKDVFAKMVAYVKILLDGFANHIHETTDIKNSNIHYLGTSGTVTTLAGVHLSLESYDRQKIDGIWMHTDEVTSVSKRLMNLSFEERSAIPSIGRERADLVMGGCAILEAMLETWPTNQLRVADRGLREGILAKLMAEDGFIKPGQTWTSQPKKNHNKKGVYRGASKGQNKAQNKPKNRYMSHRSNNTKKTRD